MTFHLHRTLRAAVGPHARPAVLPIACGLLILNIGELRSQDRPGSAVPTATELAERAAALERAIPALREATARFEDVDVALAEGYIRDPMNLCVSASTEGYPAQLGGMGVHFFRPDLLGLAAPGPRVAGEGVHEDFTQPSVLVYVPDDEGNLRLGAIENVIFAEAWRAAGNPAPPEFHGHGYWSLADNPATPDVGSPHVRTPLRASPVDSRGESDGRDVSVQPAGELCGTRRPEDTRGGHGPRTGESAAGRAGRAVDDASAGPDRVGFRRSGPRRVAFRRSGAGADRSSDPESALTGRRTRVLH